MKINWGTGIAIFYTAFVIIMISMVVYASKQGVNMVQENYYDKDINYEAFRKSRANAQLISEEIKVEYVQGKKIYVSFPASMKIEKGIITMYRPSDRHQDRSFKIEVDANNRAEISTSSLARGAWRILLDWKNGGGKVFYHERQMIL